MTLAIHELLELDPITDADVEAFIGGHEFPLVEGPSITFAFRGAADAVNLQHWIFGLVSGTPFTAVEGTDLWYHVLELPPGSRLEYKLEIQRGGKSRWIRDPLNPHLAHDPFGANSVCLAEGYERPEWTLRDPEARTGHLEDFMLANTPFGEPRRITVYVPARFRRTRRYPLLFVHDGGDYADYASLKVVLDNLIHRLEIAPLIAVLLHPGDRLTEYADDERHRRFVVDTVLPFVEGRYPVFGDPRARCLMGASFGGIASLSTAWHEAGTFGGLLLQSGSFAFTDIGESRRGPAFDRVVDFVNAFRQHPGRPADKVFVSCGVYESLIYENRSMVPLLTETGMDVRYVEARDGHNWENWRDRLRTGLSWLFPGPIWMVYE